jgi:type IV secretion system protein VirB10
MPDHVTEENQLEPQPQIVSVNSRGGSSAGVAGKLGFTLLILAVLVIGAVYGVNRYRAARAEEQARTAQLQKTEKRSGNQPGRRIFSSDPPPLPDGARVAPAHAIDPASAGLHCSDGSLGQALNGPDGRPMTTAGGQLLHICSNGQVLISPSLVSTAAPARAVATPSTAAAAAPSPRNSRYAGDILVPARHGAGTLRPQAAALPAADATIAQQQAPIPPAAAPFPSQAPAPQIPLLNVPAPSAARAAMLGDRDMILPQDRSIDCSLSVRLISEVSGRAVCVLSSYVYGDSGRVVLAEPGSVVSGEYAAMMAQGQRRLFVVWTRLKTSRGVIVNLNSPAADALGTTGLDGTIDNRWSERIGAAFLLSVVQDAIGYQTARAASEHGSGNAAAGIAVFQHSTDTGNHLAERVLESTINIKPTLYKQPGDRATILVARDLDFGSVYALRRK